MFGEIPFSINEIIFLKYCQLNKLSQPIALVVLSFMDVQVISEFDMTIRLRVKKTKTTTTTTTTTTKQAPRKTNDYFHHY